jgi:Domain of unknown function (DUF4440)
MGVMHLRFCLILIPLLLAGNQGVYADGLRADAPLYRTVKALDQKLFEAYNTCDLATLGSLVDENLEFYHDRSGLALGRESFLASIKNNICHKVRREIVASTLQVYPLENYGAIELGEHTFCNMRETPVCKDETNGIGKFFMLWQKQGEQYRLTRVISYDHLSDRLRRVLAKP